MVVEEVAGSGLAVAVMVVMQGLEEEEEEVMVERRMVRREMVRMVPQGCT